MNMINDKKLKRCHLRAELHIISVNPFTIKSQVFTVLGKVRRFENIMGKVEIAFNQHFSFAYSVFYPVKDRGRCLKYIAI